MRVVALIVVLAAAILLGWWLSGLVKSRKASESKLFSGKSDRSQKEPIPPPSRSIMPPQLVDIDEITDWIMDHLPSSISSGLESADIKKIVEWNLDFIRSKRASSNGHSSKPATQVIVAGAETAEYVLNKSTEVGLSFTPAQVHAVLNAQMTYLESMGAAGPEI